MRKISLFFVLCISCLTFSFVFSMEDEPQVVEPAEFQKLMVENISYPLRCRQDFDATIMTIDSKYLVGKVLGISGTYARKIEDVFEGLSPEEVKRHGVARWWSSFKKICFGPCRNFCCGFCCVGESQVDDNGYTIFSLKLINRTRQALYFDMKRFWDQNITRERKCQDVSVEIDSQLRFGLGKVGISRTSTIVLGLGWGALFLAQQGVGEVRELLRVGSQEGNGSRWLLVGAEYFFLFLFGLMTRVLLFEAMGLYKEMDHVYEGVSKLMQSCRIEGYKSLQILFFVPRNKSFVLQDKIVAVDFDISSYIVESLEQAWMPVEDVSDGEA